MTLILLTIAALAATSWDADVPLKNGHTVTINSEQRIAASMAVRNGRILAIAREDESSSMADPKPQSRLMIEH